MNKEDFLKKLKEFYDSIVNADYDSESLVILFSTFLSDYFYKDLLQDEEVLDKISLMCEECDIDIDKVIKLFKTLE